MIINKILEIIKIKERIEKIRKKIYEYIYKMDEESGYKLIE